MCLVAFQKMFQKIFFGVWLCSWKYHRKHIFYFLLTFSHIFSVAKRIYNIIHSSIQKYKQNPEKKSSNPIKSGHIFSVDKQIYNIIHSSIQKHKQNPEKKIIKSGQIKRRRNRERWLGSTRGCNWCGASRDRDRRKGEIAIGAVLCAIAIDGSWDRDRRFAWSRSTWRRDRDWREGEIVIGAVLCAISVISADYFSGRARLSLWHDRSWAKALYSLFFLSLSLSLSLALSLFCAWPINGLEVKWKCKTISGSKE